MTVQEMHIAVNLGVQKIASFQVDNLLPEEIEHELNLAMERFIKQKYNPTSNRLGRGFEQSQKRIDDLRHLVVQGTRQSYYPYTTNVFDAHSSPIFVDRIKLPSDYMFLVSVRPYIMYNCNTDITPDILYPTTTKTFVPLNLTPPADGYFLTAIAIAASNTWLTATNTALGGELTQNLLLNNDTYTFGLSAQISKEDVPLGVFGTTNTVEDSPTADSNILYLTYPNTMQNIGGSYIRLTWVNSNGMSSAIYTYLNQAETIYRTYRVYNDGDTGIFKASFCQHDDIFELLNDPFNKTWYKEPWYTIEEDTIDFYTDNTFLVNYGIIKYIRRPKPININIGQGCELAQHTHAEIVEMAIKSTLEGIQDPRYQSQSIENLESE
jgi:hypothetical protein